MTLVGKLMKPLFEADVPDFPDGENATTRRLAQVVATVTECCQATLFNSRFATLVPKLDAYPEELLGFAYEGAGVGLAALDTWLPWKQRTRDFVAGPGARYRFAIYLGAGMSLARMHRRPDPFRVRLREPVFGWVVLDGYGFHEGFFAHRRTVVECGVPAHLAGYARRAFDQGLGRSIWFSTGASVPRVVATIGAFPPARHPDLWSGIGLACGYTGGVDRPTIELLRTAARAHRAQLALGVVIAASARQQVDNPAPHNEIACVELCGCTSVAAAELADAALRDLPVDGAEPAYETWRRRIREHFVETSPGTPS